MDFDYKEYEDYTAPNITENTTSGEGERPFVFTDRHSSLASPLALVLVAVNALICALGLGGNALVLWICGCKMKRTVVTTWYTSLAVSNLLFCAFLPLEMFYTATRHWPFGSLLCKLASSALIFNMYSSVLLLVLISLDRFLMVTFPVWSHNHRSPLKASAIVALMWVLSALLTLPSMIYRHTRTLISVTECFTNYQTHSVHKAVAQTRFFCGFVLPFLIIIVCGVGLVVQLRNKTLKSAKPYKIMTALIGSFFLCWVPYNVFVLLESSVRYHSSPIVKTGLKVGATLAAANSFISPILYVFIGNDFKTTLKRSLTSRIEAALVDELRSGRFNSSRSKSMENLQNKINGNGTMYTAA